MHGTAFPPPRGHIRAGGYSGADGMGGTKDKGRRWGAVGNIGVVSLLGMEYGEGRSGVYQGMDLGIPVAIC